MITYMNELLFLRKTICDDIIQFHALRVCDTTSYFYGVGKVKKSNYFKKIMKNRNVLELILNLEHFASATDDVINNCEIFIQIVLYNGAPKKSYVERNLRLYNKIKTKNSISPSPHSL